MTVIYNSKAIIPGPMVSVRREIVRNEAGSIQRQFYSISAKGRMMAWKGSPNSSGAFWTGSYTPGPPDEQIADGSRLAALRSKMGALNDLFCAKGQWFEIQPFDGTPSIKFQPRVKGISFNEGKWYDYVDYSIDMEADSIYFGTEELCGFTTDVVPDETWSIEAADQIGRTYRLTHSVSSQQKNRFSPTGSVTAGWVIARDIVLPYLGVQNSTAIYAPGVLNLTTWGAYNYFRAQQIDESAGKFSVNETWLIYDPKQGGTTVLPPALDDFTIQSRLTDDGLTHVVIDGTITGLEVRDVLTGTLMQTKWEAAVLYFNGVLSANVFDRASAYSGLLLNPVELVGTVGRNPIQGTISYNAEYSNRRIPMIPGAIHEDISVQGDGGTDVFASIPVPGRPWGPVLQPINTITEKTYTISISAQMGASNILGPIVNMPNTDGIILALAPVALQVFRQRNSFSWSQETGKYSRSITFVYQ